MNNFNIYPGISTDLLFIAVAIIAAGLGIYGLLLMASLTRASNHETHGQQVDKFMMGLFNIALSLIAIYLIVISTQSDTNQLFLQTNRLLGQIK